MKEGVSKGLQSREVGMDGLAVVTENEANKYTHFLILFLRGEMKS